jgi:hypothetical protein
MPDARSARIRTITAVDDPWVPSRYFDTPR